MLPACVDFGDGTRQALGNDCSRDLDHGAFAQRYVFSENLKKMLASYPPKQRDASCSARIMKGVVREQVLMAAGYSFTSVSAKSAAFDKIVETPKMA